MTSIDKKLTLDNYQEQLKVWKEPFLANITKTANDFHEKVLKSRQQVQEYKEKSSDEEEVLKQSQEEDDSKQEKISGSLKPIIIVEEKNTHISGKVHEWKHDQDEVFADYEDLSKKYSDVFMKKLSVKDKKKIPKFEDFRKDQKELIETLYEQMKEEDGSVKFQTMVEFFNHYDLFYYFYNIHPDRILNILKDTARVYDDRLNKEEMMDLFLVERPGIDLTLSRSERRLSSISVLNDEIWEDLKNIFETLDTFGNNSVNLKAFFAKIRSSSSFSIFSSCQALEYHEINRSYTLQKILFDLENKINQNYKVNWETVEDLINNFSHITEPTIDQIYCEKIKKGIITKDSNYFMIDPQVLKIIKNIFQRCPKYCENFVKTSFMAYQMLESGLLKPFLNNPSRLENSTKKTYLTVQRVIRELSKQAPAYLDLDEILQYFSIKGVKKNKIYGFKVEQINSDTSSEKDREEQRVKRKLRKIKSLENMKKNMKKAMKKNWRANQVTKFKEFNLYHREGETIRQRKLRQMIQEKQEEQNRQLKKQFKANQIPVSLNPEKYLKYQKQMQKKKEQIKNQIALKNETHENIVEYLRSNTKLFQLKKIKRHCKWDNSEPYKFQIKPLPPNTCEELLPKIEQDKLNRRRKLLEETQKKYTQIYWKQNPNMDEKNIHSEDSLLEKINRIQAVKQFQQIRANEVPNFQLLHQKFERQLEQKRAQFKPTQIKEFRLTSPKQKNVQTEASHFASPTAKRKTSPDFEKSHSPQIQIKTTKKYEDLVAFNQHKQNEKQIQKLEKEKIEEQRLIKQRNFAKFMRKSFASYCSPQNNLKEQTKQKLKKFKFYMKQLEEETEKQLANIYSRVLQRPFLFQEASEQGRKKVMKKSKPKKVVQFVQPLPPKANEQYEYGPGLFEKQGEDFHPIESENLNQSF